MLTALTPLRGHRRVFGDLIVEEAPPMALVSLACPLGGETAFAAAVQAWIGLPPPAAGRRAEGPGGALIALTADTWLARLSEAEGLAAIPAAKALGEAAYVTEQTDAWCAVRLSGPDTTAALERLCPLDPDLLTRTAAPRTVVEHLSVILLPEDDATTILGAASSAQSLLHAIEIAANAVT